MSVVPRPTVLLRHDLPDGSHHFDWMLDLAGDDSSPLTTFRLPAPLHELASGESLSAVRIGDHRRRYLEYEGPVSGDRGAVRPVQRGVLRAVEQHSERWMLIVEWAGSATHVQTARIEFDAGSQPADGDEQPCRIFCVSQTPDIS